MFYHDFYNVDPFKPINLEFGMLSSEEVKKLSVARVDSLVPFTPLGEPSIGGLYDPRLGPIHLKGGKCSTCNQNAVSCTGHFGHIELPCPVINPIFSGHVFQLIKISCLSCNKVLLPQEAIMLMAAQLKLIDNGQLTDAHNLTIEVNSFCEENSKDLSADELDTFINVFLKTYLKELDVCYMKNTEEMRQNYIIDCLNKVSTFQFDLIFNYTSRFVKCTMVS